MADCTVQNWIHAKGVGYINCTKGDCTGECLPRFDWHPQSHSWSEEGCQCLTKGKKAQIKLLTTKEDIESALKGCEIALLTQKEMEADPAWKPQFARDGQFHPLKFAKDCKFAGAYVDGNSLYGTCGTNSCADKGGECVLAYRIADKALQLICLCFKP